MRFWHFICVLLLLFNCIDSQYFNFTILDKGSLYSTGSPSNGLCQFTKDVYITSLDSAYTIGSIIGNGITVSSLFSNELGSKSVYRLNFSPSIGPVEISLDITSSDLSKTQTVLLNGFSCLVLDDIQFNVTLISPVYYLQRGYQFDVYLSTNITATIINNFQQDLFIFSLLSSYVTSLQILPNNSQKNKLNLKVTVFLGQPPQLGMNKLIIRNNNVPKDIEIPIIIPTYGADSATVSIVPSYVQVSTSNTMKARFSATFQNFDYNNVFLGFSIIGTTSYNIPVSLAYYTPNNITLSYSTTVIQPSTIELGFYLVSDIKSTPYSVYQQSSLLLFENNNSNKINEKKLLEKEIGFSKMEAISDGCDLLDLEIISLESRLFLIRIKVISNGTLNFILLNPTTSFILSLSHINLASGNQTNGVYEYWLSDPNFDSMILYSLYIGCSTPLMLTPSTYYNINSPKLLPQYMSPFQTTIDDIIELYFIKPIIVLQGQTYGNNTLFFKVLNSNPKMTFEFACLNGDKTFVNVNTKRFYSVWDTSKQMFRIDFNIVPRLFPGRLQYVFVPNYRTHYIYGINWSLLESKFGSNATVQIQSDFADQLPPILTDIQAFPSNKIDFSIDPLLDIVEIGWNFSISDPVNGFKNAIITIHGAPFVFNVTINDAIPGTNPTPYFGYYQIQFNISKNCVNGSTFSMEVIFIEDIYGNSFSSIECDYLSFPENKIITIISDSKEDPLSLNSLVSLNSSTNYFDVGKQVDSSPLSFQFEIFDMFGVSLYYPIKLTLGTPTSLSTIASNGNCIAKNSSNFICQCDFNVTYGFGYPEYLSLTQIYYFDNSYNPKTINPDTNVSSNSVVTTFDYLPFIKDSSNITTLGGEIFIMGYNLGNPSNSAVFIRYRGDPSFSPILTTSYNSGVIKSIVIKKNVDPIYIIIKVNSKESNLFILNPSDISDPSTLSPTSTPEIKCPGTPQCGGPNNGRCTSSGCACIEPWTSNDCLSRPIIIPQPETNTTDPTTSIDFNGTLPGGQDVSFSSLISVVELREIDYKQNTIQRFPLINWMFTNTSTATSIQFEYLTNITKSSQKSISIHHNNKESFGNIEDSKTTTMKVTVEWFSEKKNITFANETIHMNPSTIKYNIQMDSYPFSSQLNTLQIILLASIQSNIQNNEIQCSNQESGKTNTNDEYVKLSINDQSLYGRFIKNAIIDGVVQLVSNKFIPETNKSSTTTQSSLMAISIPSYKVQAVLDPDFSVLIDTTSSIKDNPNSICSDSENSKKKLTKTQLAGIIIGCIGFSAIVIVSATYYLYKKHKSILFVKKILSINN